MRHLRLTLRFSFIFFPSSIPSLCPSVWLCRKFSGVYFQLVKCPWVYFQHVYLIFNCSEYNFNFWELFDCFFFFILFDRILFLFFEYSIISPLCILTAKKGKEAGVPKSTLQTFINFPAFILTDHPLHCASVPSVESLGFSFSRRLINLQCLVGTQVRVGRATLLWGEGLEGLTALTDFQPTPVSSSLIKPPFYMVSGPSKSWALLVSWAMDCPL